MLVGYARVSTGGQDPSYQIQALEGRGCERIFTERCSAREAKRPQLKATLDFLRKGDLSSDNYSCRRVASFPNVTHRPHKDATASPVKFVSVC